MKQVLLAISIFLASISAYSQARLVLNGGIVNITNSAFVVVDNPNANAVTRTVSGGHIISEGEFNRLKWNIGNTASTYTVPFGIGAAIYMPLTMTTSGAAGVSGSLTFAMYPVGSWYNTGNLPTGVTNFINNYGFDNSMYAIDRFWRIEPAATYTTKPALTNLIFTYADPEHTAPGNSIIESNLIAQRYNKPLDSWDDYMPNSIVNTGASTVTVTALPSSELYTWWTLVDNRFVLPVELTAFNVACKDDHIQLSWETASEKNNNYFVIERSTDAVVFTPVMQVPSQDPNSTRPLSYQAKDPMTAGAKVYYRLKQVDMNGDFTYSSVVLAHCKGTAQVPSIAIYPNPASHELTVDIRNLDGKKTLMIYDVTGRELTKPIVESGTVDVKSRIDVSHLAKATYILRIDVDDELFQIIKFEKN